MHSLAPKKMNNNQLRQDKKKKGQKSLRQQEGKKTRKGKAHSRK